MWPRCNLGQTSTTWVSWIKKRVLKGYIPLSTALGGVARPPCPPWGSVGFGGFWDFRIHFRGCFCAVLGFLGSEPLLELGSRVVSPVSPFSLHGALHASRPSHASFFWLSGCPLGRLIFGRVLRVLHGFL